MAKKSAPSVGLRELIRNAVYNSGSWGVNIAIVFLTTPYLVFKLTPEGYGTFALLTGLVGYYSLMDLGLGTGVTKYVAQYSIEGRYRAINHAINATLLTVTLTGALASLALVGFDDRILGLLNVSSEYYLQAKIGLWVAAIGFPIQIISNALSAVVKGLQRYDLSSQVLVAVEATKNIAMVVVVFLGYGIVALMLTALTTSLISLASNYWIARRELPTLRFRDGIDWRTFGELFNYSGSIVISNISTTFFRDYVTRFVISYFLGPAFVAYYVVPLSLMRAARTLFNRALLVIFPYASELGALEDREKLKRIWFLVTKLALTASTPIYLSLLVFAKPIMTLWMGADFAQETWTSLSLIAFASILSSLTVAPINIAMGLGYSRERSYFSLVTMALFLVLLAPATARYGVDGAIIAGTICVTLPSLAFVVFVARRIMNHSAVDFFARVAGFHLLPLLAGSAVAFLLGDALTPTLGTIAIGFAAVAAYFGTMLLTGWLPVSLLKGLRRLAPEPRNP